MNVEEAEPAERSVAVDEETLKPEPPARPAPGASQGGLALLQVLRHREFAIFWAGQAVSLIGTWMQGFGQGLVVTQLTNSAFALGLVNFCMSIPTLVLMPLGGVAADRLDRRRILIYTQWAMLALAILMGWLVQRNELQIWHVWGIALMLGVATAYDLPAYQAFYPQLVEKEDLAQAISLNQATFHGARIVGPALAGILVPALGIASAFYANAASFLAVIGSLMLVKSRPPGESRKGVSMLEQMREGTAYVKQRPNVQALLALTGITTLCIFPNLAVLMPFYTVHVMHDPHGQGLGMIMAASGAGAMLGSMLLLSVPKDRRVTRIGLCAGGILLGMSVLAWSPAIWISVVAATIQSTCISHSLGLASVIVQELVPDQLRGRVMSLYMLMFTGIMPFASLLVTRVVDGVGMRPELQASAIIYFLFAMLVVRQLRATHDPHATE